MAISFWIFTLVCHIVILVNCWGNFSKCPKCIFFMNVLCSHVVNRDIPALRFEMQTTNISGIWLLSNLSDWYGKQSWFILFKASHRSKDIFYFRAQCRRSISSWTWFHLHLNALYTPVHLVRAVGNCGLCMRRVSCTANFLLRVRFIMTPAPSIKLFFNWKLPSLSLLWTDYNFLPTCRGEQGYIF